MKKRIIPLLSALLTVMLIASLAIISGAQSTEPELKIAYCTLEFGQDTHILYAVTSEGVEKVDDIELLVWKKPQTDYTTNPAVTLKKAGEETINGDKCVVFEFTDLGAKNMTDYFYARAHVVIDGEDYYSPVNKYSVLQYAYNMLGKTGKTPTDDEDLKELLNNMLAYGASAQKYGKYKADHPANGDWHFVNIESGTLEDGFTSGLYLAKDNITVTLNEGENFSYWIDANGKEQLTNGTFTAKVGDLLKDGEEKIEIKPVEAKASSGLKFTSNGNGTCYVSGIGSCKDTDVVIPKESPTGDKVTSIGSYAFNNCKSIESITIPNSVTRIDDYAFLCPTSITIPHSVTSIGSMAFHGGIKKVYYTGDVESWLNITFDGYNSSPFCSSPDGGDFYFGGKLLTEVVVPSTVTKIGDHAFEGCKSIKSVTIPGSVKSIGYESFRNCTNIESITIENGVESIGNSAFRYCNISSIIIPDSVTSIGSSAFGGCTSLKSVTIGKGITNITEFAFNSCTSLESIDIPNSVTSIDRYAFSGCESLTSITIPDSVTNIEGGAFSYCSSLESITVESGNSVYHSAGNCLIETATKELVSGCKNSVIPTDGSVTSIGNNAFSGCTSLTSIDIPDSVTSIGYEAFRGCTSLTCIAIPGSATTIGNSAFYYCTNLTSITIPNSVTSIGGYAFYNCTGLAAITIPDGVTSIGYRAFQDCTSLKGVTIGNGVTSIDSYAFNGCTSLENVIIGNSVTSIGNSAFSGCKSLKCITIPDSVTDIGSEAFLECSVSEVIIAPGSKNISKLMIESFRSTLRNITIPNSATSIGELAFSSCSSLTSITIPDSVTSIGYEAFGRCTNLKSITIPNKVTSIGNYAFYYCTSLTSITIPDSVTNIGNYVFQHCTSLTSIVIGNGVTSLCDAFYDTNLTSIVIPSSVTSINERAFVGCKTLKKVYYGGSATKWSNITIGSNNEYLTSATRYYYSANKPTSIGNYWHYVDDVVTEW